MEYLFLGGFKMIFLRTDRPTKLRGHLWWSLDIQRSDLRLRSGTRSGWKVGSVEDANIAPAEVGVLWAEWRAEQAELDSGDLGR